MGVVTAYPQGGGGGRLHTTIITPDAWAKIAGKWVLFGAKGRETEYLYKGAFSEGLHLYGCVSRNMTPIWVCL